MRQVRSTKHEVREIKAFIRLASYLGNFGTSYFILLLITPLEAQEPATRADALRQQREEKQKTLTPYESTGVEETLDFVEDRGVFLLTREGPYPKLGSLTTGSGFSGGLGIRNRSLLKREGTIDLWAAGSIKKYFGMRGDITFPELADGRLFLQGYAEHRDYPAEDFYGLGPASVRSDQVNFALRGEEFGGRAAYQPVRRHVFVGVGLEHVHHRIGSGKDRALPSIDDVFDDTTAPGLSAQPDFLRTSAFVEVDYRRRSTRARAAGIASSSATSTTGLSTLTRSIASTSISGSSSASSAERRVLRAAPRSRPPTSATADACRST